MTRSSTMGSATRVSWRAQTAPTARDTANRPRTAGEVHPHVVPWVTASRRQTRTTVRPRVPRRSRRPPVRASARGTEADTSTAQSRPSAPQPQNTACQSAYWATRADRGTPTVAPIPTVALISPTAAATRSGGSTSRRTLMPSGTTATAAPCSARPATRARTWELSAHSRQPATRMARADSSIRRLPYRSPSRPSTGVATAPTTRVAVTAQLTVSGVLSTRSGRWGRSGTVTVWTAAVSTPPQASAATSSRGRRLGTGTASGTGTPLGREDGSEPTG